MPIKKILFLLIIALFFFIVSCDINTSTNENKEEDKPEIIINDEIKEINIITLPTELVYCNIDDINFSGLAVEVLYKNDERKTITNLDELNITHDEYQVGTNKISVSYEGFNTNFDIVIEDGINLNEHENYIDKTIGKLDFSSYDLCFNDILYAKTRTANTLIVYNNIDTIKTNIYGKEALIDEFGCVIDIKTNVDVTKGDMVLSAHGTRISDIDKLNIGDYIIYRNNQIYVYQNNLPNISKEIHDLFLRFYNLASYTSNCHDLIKKADLIKILNESIPDLDTLYNDGALSDDTLEVLHNNFYKYDIKINQYKDLYEKEEELTPLDIEINTIKRLNDVEDLSLNFVYQDKLYYGGFRNQDTLVFYNAQYYRSRNNYGYEIAVDSNGIVIDTASLVSLPTDGYILSGIGEPVKYLQTVRVGDIVEIKSDGVYFYSNLIVNDFNTIIDFVNSIIDEIKMDYDNDIKHDYKLITKIIDEINSQIPKEFNHSFSNIKKCSEQKNNILFLVKKLASLSIVFNNDTVHGMWYYPLRVDDENSVEGLSMRLDLIKELGVNNIFITPLALDGAIFENSMYVYSKKAASNNYAPYDNYLDCFISLAHQKGLKVTAFTQTFMHYESLMKINEEWTYQKEMNGEKSRGSVYYLDICNDNIQDMLYDYYNELLAYDFDGIEYDIIRYSYTSLNSYNNVEVINKDYVEDPGWTNYSINKFKELNGIDGDLKTMILNSKDLRTKWLKYKEDELIGFITRISNLIKNKNQDIVISAAVLVNYNSARNNYLQDYKKWLDLGIVDAVEPMNYNSIHSAFVINYDFYYNDEENIMYSDYVRMGISNLLHDGDLAEEFIQLRMSMNHGYIIFSSQYLNNLEYIKLIKLLYKGKR